ncbi:acyl-CoA reductase [Pseudonocardia sp. TRM90224]|uniref:acyl-CoA reductase n=1 Tax=Pseudonocardia sp. TRM90224 TaxID=2812678 RepID=UPI001E30577D|nr:acyl-CoA reductase [Pseudonocardia sp. TRM90224]
MTATPIEVGTAARVEVVLPEPANRELTPLLAEFATAPTSRPFSPEALDFCADLARTLARRARHLPEVQALAFWMRRAEVTRLAEAFAAREDDATLLVPQGTVFHVPPSNVDTLFVYSWLLAVLTGNRTVVRLSRRSSEASELLLDVLRDRLGEHPRVRDSTLMLSYGHEQSITDALSAACDLRVIWGGDGTVDAIRRSPLPPHATDVTFADRSSLAVIKAGAYAALTEEARDRLVVDFFNDAYWFDQLGCSSPRAVVWVGDEVQCAAAGADFFPRLQAQAVRKGYAVDAASAVAKLGFGYRAAVDQQITGYEFHGSALTVLSVAQFPAIGGEFCGAGTFFQYRTAELLDVVAGIGRRDQTLTHHGFDRAELRELAVALNGRGIDRMVPFGQALSFSHLWDGRDLLQTFTRRVTIGAAR